MTRRQFTARRRSILDEQLGNLRKYDLLVHHSGDSQLYRVREALGISVIELAKKMKISHQRVLKLQTDEREGRARIGQLQAAADAMDCNFVCAMIPRSASFAAHAAHLDAS